MSHGDCGQFHYTIANVCAERKQRQTAVRALLKQLHSTELFIGDIYASEQAHDRSGRLCRVNESTDVLSRAPRYNGKPHK